jgi:hypothetical protein
LPYTARKEDTNMPEHDRPPRNEVRSGAPSAGLIGGIVVLALVLIGLFWWAASDTDTAVTVDETTVEEPAQPPAAALDEPMEAEPPAASPPPAAEPAPAQPPAATEPTPSPEPTEP